MNAEGSADFDTADTSEHDAHDQAVSAVTELWIDVLDATNEKICWTGTGELSVWSPSGAKQWLGTLSSGQCLEASGGNGAYRLELSADQVIGCAWDIRVSPRKVSDSDCFTVGAKQFRGRLWSYAWQFLENGLYASKRSNNGSVFAIVRGGGANHDAVVEMQLRGVSGAHYQLYASATGPEALDGKLIGRSFLEWKDLNGDELQQADEPQATRVKPTYPLYLSPPEVASYNWIPPQVSNLRLGGRCGSRVVEDAEPGELSFDSNVEGRYDVICDVNDDGVFDAASRNDFSSSGVSVVGKNAIRWDGRNNAGMNAPAGRYDCIVRLNVGEFHFTTQDVETSYPGIRIFRLNADHTRVGRPMFWDDALLLPIDDPEPMSDVPGQYSPAESPALGLDPGSYTDASSAYYYAGGVGGKPTGNARAWGNFDGDGKGTDNFLDQVAAADSAVSAPFAVRVLAADGDDDRDGLKNGRECASGNDPEDEDSDDDGVSDGGEVTPAGNPSADSDKDGVDDQYDSDPRNPRKCRDLDHDGCDDCSRTGANRSGGDPANDGADKNHDGHCDRVTPTGAGDSDDDGVPDDVDADGDNDGIPSADEGGAGADADDDGTDNELDLDSDGDGLTDINEAGGAELDGDGDGDIDTLIDESPRDGLHDPLQTDSGALPLPDSDEDGTPDFLDADDDDDKLPTSEELDDEGYERDTDDDGTPDHLDADDDEDRLPTSDELDGDDQPMDTDEDGKPNHLDPDDDNDRLPTTDELDEDGRPIDTDDDGTPNHLDPDDDDDRLPTTDELDEDGLPIDTDDDEIANHLDPDDDNDTIPTTDELDKNGRPIDTDDDATPDHLDPDDDGDGIPTKDELGDSDKDGKPDRLEPGLQGTLAGGAHCSVSDLGGHSSPVTAWLCFGGLLACVVLRRRRSARGVRRGAGPSMSKALFAAGSLGAAAAAASPAAAQVALDQFRPAPLAGEGFGVGRPTVIPHGTFGAVLLFDYANDPIIYEQVAGDPDTELPVVDHDFVAHAGLAYGVSDHLALFTMLPVHLVMEGELPGVPVPTAEGAGLGDLVLGGRLRLAGEDTDRFALAAEFMGRLPTAKWADEGQVFRGDAHGSYEPALIAEVRAGRFDARLRAGARFREKVTVGNLELGQELVYGLGFRYRLGKTFSLHAETYGSTYFDQAFVREYSALEALGGAQVSAGDFRFGAAAGPGLVPGYGSPDVRVVGTLGYAASKRATPSEQDYDHDGLIGAEDDCPTQPEDRDQFQDSDGCPDPDNDGDGVPDSSDRCPNQAEDIDAHQDADGCPDPDNDGDGIVDLHDACPTVAEDKDGFADQDGCPDPDNDRDGILDENDRCPEQPEDYDGYEDADGCPEPGEGLIKLHCERIEIKERVYFDTASDRIQERSFTLLDQIVTMLQQVRRIKRLRVEGHADSRGPDAFNLALSQRRAESVRRYLLDHGVNAARITAEGYGEVHPIAPNTTAEGRLKNRRVEFVILESDSEGCPKQPHTQEPYSQEPYSQEPRTTKPHTSKP